MTGSRLALAAAAALLTVGCAVAIRWLTPETPTPADAALLLDEASTESLYKRMRQLGVPEIPPPQHLRPCCDFGYKLKLRYAFLPILGYTITNLKTVDEIGPHDYDSGVVNLGSQGELVSEENNGLVYTCSGGFIDTAHVRDYADWTTYLGSRLFEQLASGATIQLSNEAGKRRVVLQRIDPEFLRTHDPLALTAALAQWLAVQLGLWHEIATWYGWEYFPGFSEKASAFSPEDLYSNALGSKIAVATAFAGGVRSEVIYERSADAWFRAVLAALRPISKETAIEAMQNLDGVWWQSSVRLPDPSVLLRRAISSGDTFTPWVVPRSLASDDLREALLRECGNWPSPLPLTTNSSFDGTPLRTLARLEIEVDPELAKQPPFDSMHRAVTQDDYPAIVAVVREQNLREFGPGADRPE